MDTDLVFGEKPAKKTRAKRPAKPKAEVKPVVDVMLSDKPTKDRKAGWPIIVIDEVVGQPNYEVVSINGHVYQIMRAVEVPVPPEVVEVLKCAVEERIIQSRGPAGLIETKRHKYYAIPWRVVGYVQ